MAWSASGSTLCKLSMELCGTCAFRATYASGCLQPLPCPLRVRGLWQVPWATRWWRFSRTRLGPFVSGEQFLLNPLLVVLVMEESLGFAQLKDLSLVQGEQLEPEGPPIR